MVATPGADSQHGPSRAARSAATRGSRQLGRDLALVTTFAALIAVCGIMPAIPIGGLVPQTLQTFGVLLAGAVLGAKRGFLANALYLAVGALGLPIFSMGRAGIEPFFGPSSGYLLSYPLAALVCGLIVERLPRKRLAASVGLIFAASFFAIVAVIYTIGPVGLALAGGLTLQDAFLFNLRYYPPDILINIVMSVVAAAVLRAFPGILPERRPVGVRFRSRRAAPTAPHHPTAESESRP